MTNETNLQEKFPFLTGMSYNGKDYVGIVQNKDNQIISFYDIDKCRNSNEKKIMMECGDLWWWESNRQVPINLFIKEDWKEFKDTLVNLNAKDCEIIFGPSVSIQELSRKRSKRRNIQLVKKVK